MITLLQVSYGASSPALSNQELFPNFYRTIPSEIQANSARFALMNKYNWTKIATLYETVSLFSLVITLLLLALTMQCCFRLSSERYFYL